MALVRRTTDRDRNLTIITVSGPLTADEVIAALQEFYVQGSTGRLLWDFSNAELSLESYDELSAVLTRIVGVAKSHAPLRQKGKTAIVFPDVLGFGVGRMYGILSEVENHPISHEVFRTIDEAMTWLE